MHLLVCACVCVCLFGYVFGCVCECVFGCVLGCVCECVYECVRVTALLTCKESSNSSEFYQFGKMLSGQKHLRRRMTQEFEVKRSQ